MEWPLLSSLEPDHRAAVVAAARRRTFARGEVVFHEQDPADSLHLVVSGHLAVRVTTPDGSTALLNVLSAGDIFGELSLLGGHPVSRSATIACLDPVETRVITSSAFDALCAANPEIHRWLSVLLAQRVRELSDRVRDLMFVGLDRRLYACLLELADKYDVDGSPSVVVPLTQEHLADFVGGTRPTVNQVLQRLVGQGIVELGRGRVTVLDRAALQRKSGRDA